MSLLGRLRLADVRDPSHPLLATGMPDEQHRARLEWRRAKDAQGIIARWEEIPSARLVHGRHWVEDVESGNLYREFGGDPNRACPSRAGAEADINRTVAAFESALVTV